VKPIDPVFSWSWATPFFVAILAAELFIIGSITGGYGGALGAFAFAWLVTIENRPYANLRRARLSALALASAFLVVFVVCGDLFQNGPWKRAMVYPLFGLLILAAVLRSGDRS
jgi:hypothetical protein